MASVRSAATVVTATAIATGSAPRAKCQQPVAAVSEQPQPRGRNCVEAAAEQPVEADGEARKPRERRPRRRRPAGGDDLAGAEQPDVGELPAFLTAGTTNAAE